MSPRDLAFVGCRLLALFLLVSSVLAISFNTRFILQSFGMSEWSLGDRLAEFAFYAVPLTFLIAMFVVLWWGADWIAGKATTDLTVTSAPATESWSRHTVLSMVVTAVGLWALVGHLPVVVSFIIYFAKVDAPARDSTGFVAELVIVGLGLACVIGSGRIAGAIGRLRRWSAERPQG